MGKLWPNVRQGQPIVVTARAEAEGQIKVGDLLWYHNGIARPASLFPPGLREEDTLEGLAGLFLGVAVAVDVAQPDGSVGVIVDLGSQAVYHREVSPGDYDIGDLLTVARDDFGLHNQILVRASDPKHAIAVAMERRTHLEDGKRFSVQFCSRFSSVAALRRATA